MNSDFARAAVADTDLAMNFVAASTVYGSSASTISSSSTSFTVEAWAKSTDTCSSSAIVAGFEATWVIFCNGGYWAISMYTSNWQTTNSAYKVVAGEWVHLALTRNSSGNYVFYINGQIALSGTLAGVASNTATFLIGALPGRQYWSGSIDEVRFWNVVRTQSQVATDLRTYGSGGDSGMLLYYNFNDAPGNGTQTITNYGTATSMSLTSSSSATFSDIKTSDTSTTPGYTIIKFPRTYINSNGGWTAPANISSLDYLVVGGGGGAGWNSGGGGGGGGVSTGTLSVSNNNLAVTVGAGGYASTSTTPQGGNGASSILASITSNGGTGGDSWTATTVTPQGGASGGNSGRGGNGAKNTGFSATNGDTGTASAITGTTIYYGDGGGGGGWVSEAANTKGGSGNGGAGGGSTSNAGTYGVFNTGGGGGANSQSLSVAGGGGSGIVVVKYKNYFSISISYSGTPAKTTKIAGATTITATTTSTGTVSFYANGRLIPNCRNVAVSGTTATCAWKPMLHGVQYLTASYTSNDSLYSGSVTSSVLNTITSKRTTAR